VETLAATPRAEPEQTLRALTAEPVFGMAGRPTLEQMAWLAAEVQRRGGVPLAAEAYKRAYLARLAQRVRHREEVEARRRPAADLRVPGALPFVVALHARGVACHVASGTDESAVREELQLLEYAPYLSEIRGARPDGIDAKRALTERLTAEHHLAPGELAAFGDGAAEMECARAAGGLAVGVASSELGPPGVDPRKRARLIAAGADVIVPDFQQPAALLNYFWPAE
jgi:phosphoglycolate phosphatase